MTSFFSISKLKTHSFLFFSLLHPFLDNSERTNTSHHYSSSPIAKVFFFSFSPNCTLLSHQSNHQKKVSYHGLRRSSLLLLECSSIPPEASKNFVYLSYSACIVIGAASASKLTSPKCRLPSFSFVRHHFSRNNCIISNRRLHH